MKPSAHGASSRKRLWVSRRGNAWITFQRHDSSGKARGSKSVRNAISEALPCALAFSTTTPRRRQFYIPLCFCARQRYVLPSRRRRTGLRAQRVISGGYSTNAPPARIAIKRTRCFSRWRPRLAIRLAIAAKDANSHEFSVHVTGLDAPESFLSGSRSRTMKPYRLVEAMVSDDRSGATDAPGGKGCGSGASDHEPPLPEMSWVGCGDTKLTISNRWLWPAISVCTLGGKRFRPCDRRQDRLQLPHCRGRPPVQGAWCRVRSRGSDDGSRTDCAQRRATTQTAVPSSAA